MISRPLFLWTTSAQTKLRITINNMETKIFSKTKEVIIEDDQPTILIGERINPTGRSKLTKALEGGDYSLVLSEAKSQVQAGADILDVNIGIAGDFHFVAVSNIGFFQLVLKNKNFIL